MKNKKLYSSLLAFSLVFTQVSGNFVNVYAEEKIDDVVEVNQDNTTDENKNSDVQTQDETTTTDETKTEEAVQEETKTEQKVEESQPKEEQKVENKVEVKKEVKADNKVSEVKASYAKAVDSILLPKYDEQGKKVEQHVTETLKSHLNKTDLVATKDIENKTLTFKTVQLKDVYLNSNYVNGKSEAGISFYNMLNYYTSVKQVKQLLDANAGYTVIDSKGNKVEAAYINELLGLLDQINDIDPTTKLKYDMNSVYNSTVFENEKQRGGTDVIATSKAGNVTLRFHIDSHGWWGYDLGAHDSITGVVMGYDADTAYKDQSALTTKYGHFFVIDMGYTANNDKCYMLNGTDLENPMIYVSADKTKAFMIDVDMYGQNVINSVIKSVIGDQCKELNIFLTHLHPDHVNNLEVIAKDSKLKSITKIIWPENERFTVDVKKLFGEGNVKTIADMEKETFSETTFRFIEIKDEHTPGGGQLADLSNKINYVGDTLGAQVHLGGTTVALSQLDSWIAGMEKTEKYTKANGIKYFVGGHTPYLNNTAFATWVKTACEYAKEQMTKDIAWKGGNVVVENNKVVTGDRLGQIFSQGLTDREELNVASVNFRNDIVTNVKASYDKAIGEVTFPKYEKSGVKTDVHVSDLLKKKLDTKDLTAVKNSKDKTLKVDVQLKDLTLNSDYLNGKSEAGMSFYNMVNYFTDVKQIKQLLDKNEGYTVLDSKGNKVNAAYINELLGLIEQIMQFDTSADLKYDMDSVYDADKFKEEVKRGGTDVIATSKEGNVTLKFHIDSHGWWGYDLGADDSITSLVMGYDQTAIDADRKEHESPITKQYGNFLTIEMENKGKGKLYMLNGTDLENPMIYVSEDGKEAFMIDVDMYGKNVLNKVIKEVIGPKCESLKIFFTHMHGDHVNNVATIAEDERLSKITSIIWPENEQHTTLDGVDLVNIFGEDKVKTIADGEKINVCGNEFQFIEIPDEHTPAGGQLADLTNQIVYCGDTLGAQVHLGGTTVFASKLDSWISGMEKTEKYVKDNGIKYFVGGHTPYLNTTEFASWVKVACEYAKEQLAADPEWKGGLIIVENGKVVTGDRMGEMFGNGLSDREELNVASINFINDLNKEEPTNPEDPTKPEEPQKPEVNEPEKPNVNDDTNKDKKDPKTGDQTMIAGYALTALTGLAGMAYIASKKKKEEE